MPVPDVLYALVTSPEYRAALALPEALTEEYRPLAQGEYNENYLWKHPVTGQDLVLRVNHGSQMHLEHQIDYEANALRLLAPSGRTPKVRYVDGSCRYLDHGILVMDFLPGVPLDYEDRRDLCEAAAILADIHSVEVPAEHGLIAPEHSLKAILDECEAMVAVYLDSPLGDPSTKKSIRDLLDLAWAKADDLNGLEFPRCVINTELNNTNFLMNGAGKGYLIDWEKPLYGDPAQDLGHFLAPTTTFWKTDIIYDDAQIDAFLEQYIAAVRANGRPDLVEGIVERTKVFLQVTCLRGVTWCAMAWVEYKDPERELVNESTRRKLDQYLAPAFLERIRAFVKG